MASPAATMSTGKVARKLAYTLVGVVLFAAGLTYVYLAMRSVMDIGGSCASGGPYEISRPCPDGAGLMFLGIFGGLAGVGLVIAGTFPGGPQLWTLAWPALFCSLGWNFLVYGVDPPPPNEGLVWGWLVCAVVFMLMGGIPLIGVLIAAPQLLWGKSDAPTTPRQTVATVRRSVRPSTRKGGAAPDATRTAPTRTAPTRSAAAPFGTTTVASSTEAPPSAPFTRTGPSPDAGDDGGDPPGTPTIVVFDGPGDRPVSAEEYAAAADIVRDLERLSALHREGALTDDEFARAKAARLAEVDGETP